MEFGWVGLGCCVVGIWKTAKEQDEQRRRVLTNVVLSTMYCLGIDR